MYTDAPWEQVTQGDIFVNIEYFYVFNGEVASRSITGIVLTYECEYDKKNVTVVYVAEVKPLTDLNPGLQGHVRTHRVVNAFYLQPVSPRNEESYVDFRRIYRFAKTDIESFVQENKRVLSLTEDSRLALQHQLSLYFGYDRAQKADQ